MRIALIRIPIFSGRLTRTPKRQSSAQGSNDKLESVRGLDHSRVSVNRESLSVGDIRPAFVQLSGSGVGPRRRLHYNRLLLMSGNGAWGGDSSLEPALHPFHQEVRPAWVTLWEFRLAPALRASLPLPDTCLRSFLHQKDRYDRPKLPHS